PPTRGLEAHRPPTQLGCEAVVCAPPPPLGFLQPVQRETRADLAAAHGEPQRSCALVPVGALEDGRLSLQPAAVGLLDVLARRREDVEHELSLRLEEPVRRSKSAELLVPA